MTVYSFHNYSPQSPTLPPLADNTTTSLPSDYFSGLLHIQQGDIYSGISELKSSYNFIMERQALYMYFPETFGIRLSCDLNDWMKTEQAWNVIMEANKKDPENVDLMLFKFMVYLKKMGTEDSKGAEESLLIIRALREKLSPLIPPASMARGLWDNLDYVFSIWIIFFLKIKETSPS